MQDVKYILKPVIDLKQTGEKIKNLRKINEFSVHELKDLFGFEYPQAIYAWEKGQSIPTVDNLLVLARLFGVALDDIVCYSLVEVLCSCSEHAANCMNKDSATCEQCSFRKTA